MISNSSFIRFCFNLSSLVSLKHDIYIYNIFLMSSWSSILFCLCFFIALKKFAVLVSFFFSPFHYMCIFFLFRNFCKVYTLFYLFSFFHSSALRLSWGEMPGIAWEIPASASWIYTMAWWWFWDILNSFLFAFLWELLSIELTLLGTCLTWHQMSCMSGNVLSGLYYCSGLGYFYFCAAI